MANQSNRTGRDIPESVPNSIAELIDSNFGGLTPFAAACGLTYHEIHAILCRNNHRSLKTLAKWAEYLKTDLDTLAKIILLPKVNDRREQIQNLVINAGYESINQVCTTYGANRQWIFGQINGISKQSQISPRVTICDKLNLRLVAFLDAYEEQLAAA